MGASTGSQLFKTQNITGTCRVMCYHPDSNKHLASMELCEVENVISEWQQQLRELGELFDWVQIFENRGEIVGCSNPHPHCQIWASNFLPNLVKTKDRTQKEFHCNQNDIMLLAYAKMELGEQKKIRVVVQTDHWIALVPFWALWPFETMILPYKRHIPALENITSEEKADLARCMKMLLCAYDNLFQCEFPYSMGWLGAPTGSQFYNLTSDGKSVKCKSDDTLFLLLITFLVICQLEKLAPGKFDKACSNYWQLHAEYKPPLLRSATVKKFMAGYELLCEPQRDLTAEMAAEKLRCSLGDFQLKDSAK